MANYMVIWEDLRGQDSIQSQTPYLGLTYSNMINTANKILVNAVMELVVHFALTCEIFFFLGAPGSLKVSWLLLFCPLLPSVGKMLTPQALKVAGHPNSSLFQAQNF